MKLTKAKAELILTAIRKALNWEKANEDAHTYYGKPAKGLKREYNKSIKFQKAYNELRFELLNYISPKEVTNNA